jgi:hypothetical protein
MSNSSSNPLIAHPVSEKLTRANHAICEAHVRAAMRGCRLIGHLTGTTPVPEKEIADAGGKTTPNPAFEEWDAQDQQVLSYLHSSISKEILVHVSRSETAADAWRKIQAVFASQTRARVVNLRIALSTTKKGNMNVAEYFAKMKGYADDMAAAGRPLEDDELVEYIITGLDREFTSLVSALVARVEPISVEELYSQMLSYETRMDLIQEGEQFGSANIAGHWGVLEDQAVVVGVLGHLLAATATLQVYQADMTTAQEQGDNVATVTDAPTQAVNHVKSASRKDTQLSTVGIDMMKITSLKNATLLLRQALTQ